MLGSSPGSHAAAPGSGRKPRCRAIEVRVTLFKHPGLGRHFPEWRPEVWAPPSSAHVEPREQYLLPGCGRQWSGSLLSKPCTLRAAAWPRPTSLRRVSRARPRPARYSNALRGKRWGPPVDPQEEGASEGTPGVGIPEASPRVWPREPTFPHAQGWWTHASPGFTPRVPALSLCASASAFLPLCRHI